MFHNFRELRHPSTSDKDREEIEQVIKDEYNSLGSMRYIIYDYEFQDLADFFKDVRYSKAQKMLKFTFNALIQQLLLQLLHTAEKHHPTMFHTATVRPTRSGPNILYNTSLILRNILVYGFI